MSLVFNMVGGGGGISENRAVLVARVPDGSTVTAAKGGITLTPKMWVVESDPTQDIALFVISPSLFDSVNPWTVTATLGADTASDTVIIDDNKEYEIELAYWHGELYYHGEQFVSVTGGWTSRTQNSTSVVFYNDYMYINGTPNNGCEAVTVNTIDVTDFNVLTIVTNNTFSSGGSRTVLLTQSTSYSESGSAKTNLEANKVTTVNISNISGAWYVAILSLNSNPIEVSEVILS